MKNLLMILVLLMAVSVFGQTTPKTAREILGNKFIKFEEAAQMWGAISGRYVNDSLPIPFSQDILKKCAQENKSGKADYYLVPILGLTNNDLLSFWKIESNCLPLPTTEIGWRLINFRDENSLYFSWSEEERQIAMRGAKMLPASDYLESVATISLTRNEEKTSNFTKFFFSPQILGDSRYPEFSPKGLAVIYSANISQREALVLYFPKENFLPVSVGPNEFSFVLFEQGRNDAIIFEFNKSLRSFAGEINYEVSVLDSR